MMYAANCKQAACETIHWVVKQGVSGICPPTNISTTESKWDCRLDLQDESSTRSFGKYKKTLDNLSA